MSTAVQEVMPKPPLPNEFIPVTHLPASGQVGWDLATPDFGGRHLALNPSRLASLARLGGFDQVAVAELPSHFVELPADKEADSTNKKSGLPRVDVHIHGGQAGQLQSDVLRVGEVKHYLWPDCTLLVTSPPTNHTVEVAPSPEQTAQIWARHLDRSLKVGLFVAARQHLVLDSSKFARNVVAWEVANLCLIPMSGTLFVRATVGWITLNQLVNFGEAVVMEKLQGLPPKDRRHSLFYATQVDRLAALRVRLATQRLIKAIPGSA